MKNQVAEGNILWKLLHKSKLELMLEVISELIWQYPDIKLIDFRSRNVLKYFLI